MSFTVDSQGLAEARIQSFRLRPVVGGFALSFSISASVYPIRDIVRWLSIHSAKVTGRFSGGVPAEIGLFTPSEPVMLRQKEHTSIVTAQFDIPFSPQQLSAFETLRDASDVDLEAVFATEGGNERGGPNYWPQQQTLRFPLRQSDWVAQLSAAKAFDILLLEVPMPLSEPNSPLKGMHHHLKRAQKHFLDGNYRETVSECRQAMEEIGQAGNGEPLRQIYGDRVKMKKDDREDAIIAVIKHYAHLAAHAESGGGSIEYSRSEARLVLSLAAACIAKKVQS